MRRLQTNIFVILYRSAMYAGCKERLLVGYAGTLDGLAEAYALSMKASLLSRSLLEWWFLTPICSIQCAYFTRRVRTVDGEECLSK